jgi:putative alpha-1,2-mannosidase
VENDTLLTGCRLTNGWARTNYTYFAISLSRPLKEYGYRDLQKVMYNGFWRKFNVNDNFPEMAGRKVVAWFEFNEDIRDDNDLVVKVALSATSTDGALKNLQTEASGKSFDTLVTEASDVWQRELSTIPLTTTPSSILLYIRMSMAATVVWTRTSTRPMDLPTIPSSPFGTPTVPSIRS